MEPFISSPKLCSRICFDSPILIKLPFKKFSHQICRQLCKQIGKLNGRKESVACSGTLMGLYRQISLTTSSSVGTSRFVSVFPRNTLRTSFIFKGADLEVKFPYLSPTSPSQSVIFVPSVLEFQVKHLPTESQFCAYLPFALTVKTTDLHSERQSPVLADSRSDSSGYFQSAAGWQKIVPIDPERPFPLWNQLGPSLNICLDPPVPCFHCQLCCL